MHHRCDNCPGKNGLQEYFQYKLENANYEEEMMIHFKQWVSTDRTALEERIMPTCDFLDKLIQEIDQLTTHHYIARNQSQYLKHLKDTLKPKQAIINNDLLKIIVLLIKMQYKAFTGIIHKLHSTALQFIMGNVTVNLKISTSASSVIASNTTQLQSIHL